MADYNVSLDELRTRITFQEPTVSQDAGGAQTITYANISSVPTVWARWIFVHGIEAVSNDALKNTQRATVTIRYRTDILPTWVVVKDGEVWRILSIDHVQDRNHWTEMIVERAKGTL